MSVPAGKYAKQSSSSTQLEKIVKLRDITDTLIKSNFALLQKAPNYLYIAMSIWGYESSFNLLHGKKGTTKTSRHLTVVNPRSSSYSGAGTNITGKYFRSSNIQTILNNSGRTPTEVYNVEDGYYAHGLSACMGCYHVKNTPTGDEFKQYSEHAALIAQEGLQVNPGESISALFTDDEAGWRKSIASGLIILDQKYRKALIKAGGNTAKAIQLAVGYYLGTPGVKDANGLTPEGRISQVFGTQGNVQTLLAQADIKLYDDKGSVIDTTGILAKGSTSGGTVSNSSSKTVVATTSGEPKTPVGCQA